MITENPNRYRVSSKFTLTKIFVFIGLFSILFNLIRALNNDTFILNAVVGLIFGALLFFGLLYLVRTRKTIEYDDMEHSLYVLNSSGQLQMEIPVEKIDKILYSSFGLGNVSYSYVIIYRDFHNQKQEVRLFPIAFRNDIETIILDTKLKNPDVVTSSWSIGWN